MSHSAATAPGENDDRERLTHPTNTNRYRHGMTGHGATFRNAPFPVARELAYGLGRTLAAGPLPLADCLGAVLAEPIHTLTDLPAFDTASMDGWAVSGTGPWQVTGTVLAGEQPPSLSPGEAVEIATGAQLPDGAVSVLRREYGVLHDRRLSAQHAAPAGSDIRRKGEEADAGERVLAAGCVVTPPVLGLAAASGLDALNVHPRPTVDVLVLGDELTASGPSSRGRVRDSIGPQIPGWVDSVGARVGTIRHVADREDATMAAFAACDGDIIVTTGGTARGPVDQLHPVLERLQATIAVDQVAVRPGHPMLLAQLPHGTPVVGLPGNPLAAAVGFVSLGWPLIFATRGLPIRTSCTLTLVGTISAPTDAHRLMPSAISKTRVQPLPHHGPAMLSGLAAADGLAIAPPGGVADGATVEVLRLPWSVQSQEA
jgi:molybdopterin molybdotransferase